MWTCWGPGQRYCDGVSRRSFLQIGGLAAGGLTAGGLTLADLLRVEAAESRRSHKAVIMVYLSGGLPHQDTFDLKPQAPAEIRGEFQPISTVVPGINICEHLPKLAAVMNHCSLVRSIVGQRDEHTSFQNLTGYPMNDAQRNQHPNFGSAVARVLGAVDPLTPPFVDMFPTMQHRPYNSTGAGILGSNYNQVRADGEDLASMKLRYIETPQFQNRRQLLTQLDDLRRTADTRNVDNVAENYRRAFDVLTSSKIVDALDVTKADPQLRERYGIGSSKHLGDGAPLWNDQLLTAKRLVEAGVRVVTVAYGFWDTHGNNFRHMKQHLPTVDAGLSSLVQDLVDSGLDQDVSVVVWGEFGRTPKINNNAGRDHWAPVQSVLFAGGGMRMGQVIGATDKDAAYASDRPIHYRDVLATIYHNLGVDPHDYVRDINDRPITLLPDDARPIRELIATPSRSL